MRVGHVDFEGGVLDLGLRGIETELVGRLERPPQERPGVPDSRRPQPAVAARTYLPPIICRRDDYPFLAPGAIGGQRCDVGQPGETIDPEQVARARFAGLELPSLRLNMNPRLGMVAVPTWFWVEGYDGSVVPLTSELAMPREECREIPELNADGEVILNRDGTPVTLRECTIVTDHMTVEVRVWPRIDAGAEMRSFSRSSHPGLTRRADANAGSTSRSEQSAES
jgi:hypothetical protein